MPIPTSSAIARAPMTLPGLSVWVFLFPIGWGTYRYVSVLPPYTYCTHSITHTSHTSYTPSQVCHFRPGIIHHHPMIVWRWRLKGSSDNGLVNKSAGWSSDEIFWRIISPFSTRHLKWWSLLWICLVWGLNLNSLAISKAPELSSNTVHRTVGDAPDTGYPCSSISFNNSIIRMTSLKA